MKTIHKKAFTMIELIFVIVIIGILAAVAIPKLAATRDDAEISKIVANAKIFHQDLQNYYTSQGNTRWISDDISNVTSIALYDGDCSTPATSISNISPNTFVLCSDNDICLTFATQNDGNLTIADGSGSTSIICEAVKTAPAVVSMSNKSYILGGETVQR